MPMPPTNPHTSPVPHASDLRRASLARLFLGVGLLGIVLFFGLIVWQLVQLPRAGQPAAKQQTEPDRLAATPRTEIIEDAADEPAASSWTVPTSSPSYSEVKPQLDPDRKQPVVEVPPRLPDTRTADAIFEQRVRASEEELRGQLREVPELRLLSDLDVQKVRNDETTMQHPSVANITEMNAATLELNAASARLDAARANLAAGRTTAKAYQEAARACQEASRHYDEISRRYQQAIKKTPSERELQRIGYDFNLRLHRDIKRAAIQAGLELDTGPTCQLDPPIAAQVAKLSKDLRDKGFVSVPGVPLASRSKDQVNLFQTWCDQNGLELRSGAVPTLTQMLQIEDEATRLLLVRELTQSRTQNSTVELALRAIVDLSPAVRQAALTGLEQRPSPEYLPILLRGLRYAWPPVADHAAVALRTLKPKEAVAPLVNLIDLTSPTAPVYDAQTKQYAVREMVRLNHLRNCLLCHAPSMNKSDGLVRGLVPTPGNALPVQYYESPDGDFVRADITYLRQDFSTNLPVKDALPWPEEQRFDFVTRLRTATPSEIASLAASPATYPQREAVLYALRGLTGKDGGPSSARWRELLGIRADKPNGEKKKPALENIAISTTDPARSR